MQNETINPIRHGVISGATQTTAGVATGAVKTGVKSWLGSMGTFIAIGAVVGFTIGTGGLGTIATGAIAGPIIGGLVGGLVGIIPSGYIGGLGALIGGFTGGKHAVERVSAERGAANMLDAQLQAYQAQAYAASAAPTTVYAPTAANNNYPTASTMNQAGTKIQADAAQDLGTINGQALAAAR